MLFEKLDLQRLVVGSATALAMLSLPVSAQAKAAFEPPTSDGGGGLAGSNSGGIKVEVPPTIPPAPGTPPPPVVYDTSTFTWTMTSGLFYFPDVGGPTITSAVGGASGSVTVKRQDGGKFVFGGIDYAYSTFDTFLGDEALLVQGFSGGNLLATANLIQPIANAGNFSSFGAGGLTGIEVDQLIFHLDTRRTVFDADLFPTLGRFSTSIRNIDFAETGPLVAVPEPAAWALMVVGLGVLGLALRRQIPHAA